jgi:hypothetical protein
MKFALPAAKVEWEKFVAMKTAQGMTRQKAVAAVAKEHAALRARLIREANEQKGSR